MGVLRLLCAIRCFYFGHSFMVYEQSKKEKLTCPLWRDRIFPASVRIGQCRSAT